MTDEEYARYSPWQQQLQNQLGTNSLSHPYNQQPYEPCGPALQPVPTTHYALRLSDEDVARIAEAVVERLRMEPERGGFLR